MTVRAEEGGRTVPGLVIWFGLTALAAAVGAASSVRSASFYAQLQRPEWAPPSSVFSPVWTILYLLMATGAFLVWRRQGWAGGKGALTLYLVQLVLNAAWTWLFFGARNGALAFGEIVVLVVAIAATIVAFWRVRPLAGALLLPYLGWTLFATALTWSIWRANPAL